MEYLITNSNIGFVFYKNYICIAIHVRKNTESNACVSGSNTLLSSVTRKVRPYTSII